MGDGFVKSAQLTDREIKMLKHYLASGVASALLGSGLMLENSRKKAEKERRKALDVASSKNAITVNIEKGRFMSGLPKPSDFAKDKRGAKSAANGESGLEAGGGPRRELTEDEIRSMKKEILAGRRLDFFGKRASDGDGVHKDGGKAEGGKRSGGDDPVEKEERTLPPRDEGGRFVSPTDPLAVVQQEKDAGDGSPGLGGALNSVVRLFTHPKETAEGFARAGMTGPVFMTAGAIGSFYLAGMIVDRVNEIRARKRKLETDVARDEYSSILQAEKQAESIVDKANGFLESWRKDDYANGGKSPFALAGSILGTSFFAPLALSALIANKIMERRSEDKKKEKSLSYSFPDDPVILYRTFDGKDMRVTPETALASMAIKRAMLVDAEKSEAMRKCAQMNLFPPLFAPAMDYVQSEAKPYVDTYKAVNPLEKKLKTYGSLKNGRLPSAAYTAMSKGDLDDYLINAIRDLRKYESAPNKTLANWFAPHTASLYGDSTAAALIMQQMSNKKGKNYAQWKKLQDEIIDDEFGNMFGKEGFGGWFGGILAWLAKNTGFGSKMVRDAVYKRMSANPYANANGQQAGTPDPAAQTPPPPSRSNTPNQDGRSGVPVIMTR